MLYIDTSVILKLYVLEKESEHYVKILSRFQARIPLTSLHELETRNALHLKLFRKEISINNLNKSLYDLEEDISKGYFHRIQKPQELIFKKAFEISSQFTKSYGIRSMDILHIAQAHLLEAQNFLTHDDKQKKVAQLVGMKTDF